MQQLWNLHPETEEKWNAANVPLSSRYTNMRMCNLGATLTSLNITFSSDALGFPKNSTVIAAVLRRSKFPIHIKFYCQRFHPESFTQGQLQVEFLKSDQEMAGNYPGHVASAVFDRLQVIRDAKEWDRCLIMDHDMLALCDLAPYFAEDFEGNFLMGRLLGLGNTLGMQMSRRGGLPEKLKHTTDYPYFYMGPMMNLKLMRKEGTWEKLLAAHEILGQEEQMALTAACGGRVKGVGRKWNLVPHWDNLAEGPSGPERSLYGTVGEAAKWKNGLPEGIIHWTEWAKPWHYQSQVWRPDLWESEECSWEALRNGWWEKPLACLVEHEGAVDHARVSALARRGWKVDVWRVTDCKSVLRRRTDLQSVTAALPYPDVRHHRPTDEPHTIRRFPAKTEYVRFAPGLPVAALLENVFTLPDTIILQGPVPIGQVQLLRKLGYTQESRLLRHQWADGGPSPSLLDFTRSPKAASVEEWEDLYLRRPCPPEPKVPVSDKESKASRRRC